MTKRARFFLAIYFLAPCAALLFCACQSAGIPGENAKILRSLASEYFTIAGAYANLGRYENALTYSRLAGRDKNYFTAARYESARMCALLTRWDEAEKIYTELLKNDPRNKDIASSIAYVRAMSGNLAGAEEAYKNLLLDNLYDAQLHENYIRILAAQKKGDDAKAAFETYKELFSSETSESAIAKLAELLAPYL
jgi:tetratricopeptide (TPR) repeat protein